MQDKRKRRRERIIDTDYLDVVTTLRDEASDLKECFNRQCFQVIAIVSTLYIYIFHFMFSPVSGVIKTDYGVGISGYIGIILIVTVLNVGIYKFEAANRLIGYILHLERQNMSERCENKNSASILNWETSIKAWRVFHTPIDFEMYEGWNRKKYDLLWSAIRYRNYGFAKILLKERFFSIFQKGKLKAKYRDRRKYRWYLPSELVHSEGAYSPGNYLRRMMFMLHILGATAIIMITLGTFLNSYSQGIKVWFYILYFPSILLAIVYMWMRPRSLAIRIESEFFCIHSCSIFWDVVSKAHERTLKIINNDMPLKHYSFILSCLSLHYIKFGIDRSHEWCDDKTFHECATFILEKLSDYPVYLQDVLKSGLLEISKCGETSTGTGENADLPVAG